MKRWLIMMAALVALTGCSQGQESTATEVDEAVVEEVEAESPESETAPDESAGMYYLNETHPAIVDIWDEFDALYETQVDSITDVAYDEEYAYTVFTSMIAGYEELSVLVDELPVESLDADQEHLEKFKENSKMANDLRIQYAETILEGLGANGIAKASMDEAQEYLETSNTYSVESMEDVNRYEDEKGF